MQHRKIWKISLAMRARSPTSSRAYSARPAAKAVDRHVLADLARARVLRLRWTSRWKKLIAEQLERFRSGTGGSKPASQPVSAPDRGCDWQARAGREETVGQPAICILWFGSFRIPTSSWKERICIRRLQWISTLPWQAER